MRYQLPPSRVNSAYSFDPLRFLAGFLFFLKFQKHRSEHKELMTSILRVNFVRRNMVSLKNGMQKIRDTARLD